MPFLVMFTLCVSLCSFLSYKMSKEALILLNMKEVNHRIQKERQIVEIIFCLIQCDDPYDQSVMVDQEEIWLDFEENMCFVSGPSLMMEVEFNRELHCILEVRII